MNGRAPPSKRAVCFVFERARAPRHFLFGKGHPMRKLLVSTVTFQGHQGNDKGQRRRLIAFVASVKYQACALFALQPTSFNCPLNNHFQWRSCLFCICTHSLELSFFTYPRYKVYVHFQNIAKNPPIQYFLWLTFWGFFFIIYFCLHVYVNLFYSMYSYFFLSYIFLKSVLLLSLFFCSVFMLSGISLVLDRWHTQVLFTIYVIA